MSKKTLPSKISTEDLIKALETIESNEGDVSPEELNFSKKILETSEDDILAFMATFKLEQGPNLINSAYLYKVYRSWSKNASGTITFNLKLSNYLDFKVKNVNKYYYVNNSELNISESAKTLFIKKTKIFSGDKKTKNKFDAFIKKFGLYPVKQGVWVRAYLVFYFYDNWSYDTGKMMPLNTKSFLSMCNIYFKTKAPEGRSHYYVNKDFLDYINPEFIQKAKEWTASRHENKKQKKQNKVPSSGS